MLIESFRNSKVKKLYVMDYGLFQVHANGRIIGITGSLIETDDGKWVLVDTGFPPKYVADRENPHARICFMNSARSLNWGLKICRQARWRGSD